MIRIRVRGMSCGHCEKAVTKALESVEGVERVVEVDRAAERAVVDGSPNPEELIAAITEEGFSAELIP